MAQHDYVIDNQSFPATRTDINNVLQAIASNNSGTSAPSTTYANQFWYDTTNNKLYQRNEDDDAWIELAVLDQANDIVSSITSETLVANIVNERTTGTGVTIDGLLIKDKEIGTSAAPATLQASAINGGQIGGRRNLIINGAQQVFQRSTSATGVTTDTYSAPDRWKTRVFSTAEFTISQSTDVPSGQGFGSSCKWDCTTANASPSSTTFLIYEQRIEGQDLQRLAYGTSSAKSLTASFWVKSNKTGAYTVGLYSPDGSRHIESSYTISSANTWEKKTITFAGDTGGTINDDTGEGMRIWFHLGAGSNWSSGTHATTWSAYSQGDVLVDNQVNLSDSTSNEWYITGVQLEVGSVATEFEHRSFGEELALCQRYYEKNYPQGTAPASSSTLSKGSFVVHSSATITYRWTQQFKVTKRAAPTSVIYSTTGASGNVRLNNSSDLAVTIEDSGDSGFAVYALNRSSTGGEFYWWNWVADAEL